MLFRISISQDEIFYIFAESIKLFKMSDYKKDVATEEPADKKDAESEKGKTADGGLASNK